MVSFRIQNCLQSGHLGVPQALGKGVHRRIGTAGKDFGSKYWQKGGPVWHSIHVAQGGRGGLSSPPLPCLWQPWLWGLGGGGPIGRAAASAGGALGFPLPLLGERLEAEPLAPLSAYPPGVAIGFDRRGVF